MPAITRELSITYAGVTLGGTSDFYLLDGPYRLRDSYQSGRVECEVVCRSTSESDFNTKIAALEAAFRTPNGALVVTLGSETLTTWSHSANTGTLARPTIEKVGDEAVDSGRARRYRIAVEVQRPATLSGKDGLREAEVSVVRSPSDLKTMTIAGTYTALSSNSAVTQLEASIAALQTTIEGALTGTYKRLPITYARDDEDKLVRFSAVSEQLVASLTSGTLASSGIQRPSLVIRRESPGPGDRPGAQRPDILRVTFECWVDVDTSTDMASFWAGTIRPFLLTTVRAASGAAAVALIAGGPALDQTNNRISADLTFSAVVGGSLLEHRIRSRETGRSSTAYVAVANGDPFGRLALPVPGYFAREITEIRRTVGVQRGARAPAASSGGGFFSISDAFGALISGAGAGSFSGSPGVTLTTGRSSSGGGTISGLGGGSFADISGNEANMYEVGFAVETEPVMVGVPDSQYPETLQTRTRLFECANLVTPGGGGGGGRRISTSARNP